MRPQDILDRTPSRRPAGAESHACSSPQFLPHPWKDWPGTDRRGGAGGHQRGDVRGIREGLTFKRYSRATASIRSTRSSGRRATPSSPTTRRAATPSSSGTSSSRSPGRRTPPTSSHRSTSAVRSARRNVSRVRQLVGRVVDTITGRAQGPLLRERRGREGLRKSSHLLVTQKAAFNSPVWFNVGVPDTPQQCSACFILAVDDTMSSILNWYVEEGRSSRAARARDQPERIRSSGSRSPAVAPRADR